MHKLELDNCFTEYTSRLRKSLIGFFCRSRHVREDFSLSSRASRDIMKHIDYDEVVGESIVSKDQ